MHQQEAHKEATDLNDQMALDVDQSDGRVVAGVDNLFVQSLLRGKNLLGEIARLLLFFGIIIQVDGSILKLNFLSRRNFVELLLSFKVGCLIIRFRQF